MNKNNFLLAKKLILVTICSIYSNFMYAQDNVDEALAYQYYQQADYEKAVAILEKFFSRNVNEGYFNLYYNALLKIKKYEQAEAITKKLIKLYPQKTHYQIALGRVLQEKGKNTEAAKIFENAIQNSPKTEFNYRELANSFYAIEAYDMAINTFLQGRKSLNDEQLFTFELLNIYRFKKDKQQVINEYLNALSYNPKIILQAQSTMANLFDSSNDYYILQAALLKRLQKDPDNEVFTELLTWQYIQQQNYEMAFRQLLAQDKRLKNASEKLYDAASVFIANKAYSTAIKVYEYLLTKGTENEFYVPSRIQLVNAKYELTLQSKDDKDGMKSLTKELTDIINQYGVNRQTLFAVKKLSYLQAYQLNDLAGAEKTLEQALNVFDIPGDDLALLKLDLGDIYILNKQPWEALLLYEQVSKAYENQPVGSEARFRSARLSFYQGNFKYSKSQADVLKASTTQLIANDALNLSLLISDNLQSKNDSAALAMYADAEMLQFTNKLGEALQKLDSISLIYTNNSLADDILMAKAKIYVKNNNNTEAAEILKTLVKDHFSSIWIDDAIFMLAEIYETKLNIPEEAKKLYQLLTTDFPGSMLNAEARKRYRNLRGDNLGS